MNKPLWKQAAEMYALKMIAPEQVLDVCDNLQQAKEAFEYAEDYSAQYDLWQDIRCKKAREVEAAWKSYPTNDDYYMSWDEIYPKPDELPRWYWLEGTSIIDVYAEDYDKAEAERHSPYYTDEELQEAFDTFCRNRRDQILRIGKEAEAKKIPRSTIYKFMQNYKLNSAERTVFWLAYYGAIV